MTDPHSNSDPHNLSEEAFEQTLTTGAGTCPPPELVLAAHEDVLPEELAAPVLEHIAHCELCAVLLPDDAEDEPAVFSTAQEARILARIQTTPPSSSEAAQTVPPESPRKTVSIATGQRGRRPLLYAIAAGFVAAVFLTGIHIYLSGTHDVAQVAQTPPATQDGERQQALQSLAEVEPLPPPAPQSTDLIARGGDSEPEAQPEADELLPGFRAYNRHDYEAAMRIFKPLAERYPHAALPRLYLGISQLESHQEAAAAQTLTPLAASPDASPNALWFAAVAAVRSQDFGTGAALFKRLCATLPGGERHDQSCHFATVFQP